MVEVRRGGDVTAVGKANDESGDWRGETRDLVEHNYSSPGYARRY
jgi:hypothetical protein